MDIPNKGSDQEIRLEVKARLKKAKSALGGTQGAGGGKSRGKGKAPAGWEPSELISLLLDCDIRTAKRYWKAFCECHAADLVNRGREHDGANFPYLEDSHRAIIDRHRRRRAKDEIWICRAEWENELEPIDTKSKQWEGYAVDLGPYFPVHQIDHPPQNLVDSICEMRIKREHLIDIAFRFCKMATQYEMYVLKRRARKGGKRKNSHGPEPAEPAQSRKPVCSEKLKLQLLAKIEASPDKTSDVRTLSGGPGFAPSTVATCLRLLVLDGRLVLLPGEKSANRYGIPGPE